MSCADAFDSDRNSSSIAPGTLLPNHTCHLGSASRRICFPQFSSTTALSQSKLTKRASDLPAVVRLERVGSTASDTCRKLTIRNTDKATLPATSATREVPASRCTEAPPARMQASRPHSFTVWDPPEPHKRPLECRMRRCAYRDSYALRPHQRAASGRSKPSAVPRVSGFITRIASY